MTKHVGKAMNKASMYNDVLCLEFTPDSIENPDKNCHIILPFGKADNTPSSALSRACGILTQLHP